MGTLAWSSLHEQFGDCASLHLYSEALRGPWPGAHYTSSSVTVPVPTCTVRLCGDPGLCGSGSTRTMNSEEDQSLVYGWWWHGWLRKLIAIPLSTVSSCPQVTNLTRRDVAIKAKLLISLNLKCNKTKILKY